MRHSQLVVFLFKEVFQPFCSAPGGPGFDAVRFPRRVVLVSNNRVINSKFGDFAPQLVNISLEV